MRTAGDCHQGTKPPLEEVSWHRRWTLGRGVIWLERGKVSGDWGCQDLGQGGQGADGVIDGITLLPSHAPGLASTHTPLIPTDLCQPKN